MKRKGRREKSVRERERRCRKRVRGEGEKVEG